MSMNVTNGLVDYQEIAKQRIDSFDQLAMSNSLPPALLKKYNKALKDDTVVELAQEYYEGVFKPIYEDSVNKVLNSLKKETKGAIKTKPKQSINKWFRPRCVS